jgi:hypothetical protein
MESASTAQKRAQRAALMPALSASALPPFSVDHPQARVPARAEDAADLPGRQRHPVGLGKRNQLEFAPEHLQGPVPGPVVDDHDPNSG